MRVAFAFAQTLISKSRRDKKQRGLLNDSYVVFVHLLRRVPYLKARCWESAGRVVSLALSTICLLKTTETVSRNKFKSSAFKGHLPSQPVVYNLTVLVYHTLSKSYRHQLLVSAQPLVLNSFRLLQREEEYTVF